MNVNRLAKTLRGWLSTTPDRALDEAYRAALQIKAIEDEHFQGDRVSPTHANYSASVIRYFRGEVDKHLRIARVRLVEFRASRALVGDSPLLIRRPPSEEQEAITLEKLNFVDQVLGHYLSPSGVPNSLALVPLSSNTSTMSERPPSPDSLERNESFNEKTGLLPRSILRTFGRIQQEMSPKADEAEEEMLNRFRSSRSNTALSIRFLLMLVLIPLLVHQMGKLAITPLVEQHFFTPNNQEQSTLLFINEDMEEEALKELQHYREALELRAMVGLAPPLSEETIGERLKEKADEILKDYRDLSQNAIANIFADACSFGAFMIIFVSGKRAIGVLKGFIDEIVYGLSDSAKAFLIILFTDIFVGYHSPHGWEIVLEGIARHFGLPENREFNFLFIATFPVILDTVLKYWIFRYLNRISPSAVATYRNMNE